MTKTELINQLRHIVGDKYLITDPSKSEAYRSGYRFGNGNALAVVRPGNLTEFWAILKACVAASLLLRKRPIPV